MKVVSWNCNGALRNKLHELVKLNADIYIIQECENPINYPNTPYELWGTNHLWIGNSKNRGLGIFARRDIDLLPLNWSDYYSDHQVKLFLPCLVNNDFQLLGVWTKQNSSPNFGYIGQFWKYLQINLPKLNKILIAGDFNSSKKWDQWDRWWNHTDVVRQLKEKGIESLYHTYYQEKQSEERIPTFYHHKNPEKPYHIDYFFGSPCFQSMESFSIGKPINWLHLSDHMPLVLDL